MIEIEKYMNKEEMKKIIDRLKSEEMRKIVDMLKSENKIDDIKEDEKGLFHYYMCINDINDNDIDVIIKFSKSKYTDYTDINSLYNSLAVSSLTEAQKVAVLSVLGYISLDDLKLEKEIRYSSNASNFSMTVRFHFETKTTICLYIKNFWICCYTYKFPAEKISNCTKNLWENRNDS